MAELLTARLCGLRVADDGITSIGHSEGDYARHEEICTGVNPINEDREVIDLSCILPNNDPRVQFAGDSDEDEGTALIAREVLH